MTKKQQGPSPEYRELLKGRISSEDYVKNLKREVNGKIGLRSTAQRRAAST